MAPLRQAKPHSIAVVGILAAMLCSCHERRPEAVLAFTGNTRGDLEPCGCSERETGGLSRRDTYLQRLAAQYESAIFVDSGDTVGGSRLQDRLKVETLAAALDAMGYAAVNLGPRDLVFGVDFLYSLAASVRMPLVSANLVPRSGAARDWPCKPYVVREIAIAGQPRRIAIVGVMSARAASKAEPQARIEEPRKALACILPRVRQTSDFVVLLAQTSPDEAAALVRAAPGIDVVVCGHTRDIPARVDRLAGGPPPAPMFEPGKSGGYVGSLPLRLDANGKVVPGKFRVEILNDAYARSPAMDKRVLGYRALLRDMDLLGQLATMAAKPKGGAYVGNEACGACHAQDYAIWRLTKHSHGYRSLAATHEYKEFDPECVTCHVVGLGYQTGFTRWERTPWLGNVGCESCHGAGRQHVGDPAKPYGKCGESKCRECHTDEHSTDFDYKRYWPAVRHGLEKVGKQQQCSTRYLLRRRGATWVRSSSQ